MSQCDSPSNPTPHEIEPSLNGDGVNSDTVTLPCDATAEAAANEAGPERLWAEEIAPPQTLADRLDLSASPPPHMAPAPKPPRKPREDILGKELLTDRGNGQRLIRLHGGDLRYCAPWKKWLRWDGTRWAIDETLSIDLLTKRVIRDLYFEALAHSKTLQAAIAAAPDPISREQIQLELKKIGMLAEWAKRSEHVQRLGAMERLARSEPGVPVMPGELDQDPWLLNCPNGTLDLRTGRLRKHRRTDMITVLCPTRYDPAATCPTWEKLIRGIFLGDPDLGTFFQRALGRSLTGDVSVQILTICWGSGGNGKGTALNKVQEIMGLDYAMSAGAELLMARKGERHTTELTDLFGKRFVIAHEPDEGCRLNESLVKRLTGGDKIRARRMKEDNWEFPPTHKVFLLTNHQPRIRGTDPGIWRRIRMLPFEARFWDADEPGAGEDMPPEMVADKSLPQKLVAEHEGILAWLVRGCLDWQKCGLELPEKVKAATSEYRKNEDTLALWIEECCSTGDGRRERGNVLYASYRDWCETNGERPLSGKVFGVRIGERFAKKVSNGVWYHGIATTH